MMYEEAYEKAKELEIKEVKTKSNGDYVYVVVNIGKRNFGITRNWMEFMYERMFRYYEGASDDMCIEYYLKNCEVVEHDKTMKER